MTTERVELPLLGMPDVRDWVGERSFTLGRDYFRRGAVSDMRRQGLLLKARVQGTARRPYRVQVTLGARGIVSATCSCPVGDGGRCKHAAALLVAWLGVPEEFTAAPDLEAALQRMEKAELLKLVARMLRHAPDLEEWLALELPLVSASAASTQKPLDEKALRRQVKAALRDAGGDYGEEWGEWEPGTDMDIASTLDTVFDTGEAYLARGDYYQATLLYQTVAETAMEEYNVEMDGEGEVAGSVQSVVTHCIEGLDACLAGMADADEREEVLRGLFTLWQGDPEGYDLSDPAAAQRVLLARATPAERRLIAHLARAALPQGAEWGAIYRRQQLGELLLALEADLLDDEAYLTLCRETGQTELLIERLLSLGRTDAATAAVRADEHSHRFLALADLLRANGQVDAAERLVRERARAHDDDTLTHWLLERAQEAGRVSEALELAETLFWRYPSVDGYKQLRELASALDDWDAERRAILSRLTGNGQFALLTQIHVLEGAVDAALASLAKVRGGQQSGWGFDAQQSLRILVAEAAEQSHPSDAIRLYLAEAEQLVEAQGRERYATAAGYLTRVRALFQQQGRDKEWQHLIAELRSRERRLRAFQDELSKAGL